MDISTRQEVSSILSEYRSEKAGIAGREAGTAIGTGLSMGLVVFLYFLFVPTFIIGLSLTLKKKVWRCTECGCAIDRT